MAIWKKVSVYVHVNRTANVIIYDILYAQAKMHKWNNFSIVLFAV